MLASHATYRHQHLDPECRAWTRRRSKEFAGGWRVLRRKSNPPERLELDLGEKVHNSPLQAVESAAGMLPLLLLLLAAAAARRLRARAAGPAGRLEQIGQRSRGPPLRANFRPKPQSRRVVVARALSRSMGTPGIL